MDKSKFFKEKASMLVKEYQNQLPYVVKIEPVNGSVDVKCRYQRAQNYFSQEMVPATILSIFLIKEKNICR